MFFGVPISSIGMKIKVSPTRMELLRLKKRYAVTVRAHKLLKDKLEGLMKEFLLLVEGYKKARLKIDNELPGILKLFVLATITSNSQIIATALDQSGGQLEVRMKYKRIMNINTPSFEAVITPGTNYSFLDTPVDLDDAVAGLKGYLPAILRLAELEQSVRLIAKEIEKTRRRVNALEHVMIPNLKETIKFIKDKLDEMERSNISRIMKIKEMIAGRR